MKKQYFVQYSDIDGTIARIQCENFHEAVCVVGAMNTSRANFSAQVCKYFEQDRYGMFDFNERKWHIYKNNLERM